MQLLNIISIIIWLIIAYDSLSTYATIKEQGLSKNEVISATILLLCGLNISIGILSVSIGSPNIAFYKLIGYFYIGSTIFQLLLCNIVLNTIRCTAYKNNKD